MRDQQHTDSFQGWMRSQAHKKRLTKKHASKKNAQRMDEMAREMAEREMEQQIMHKQAEMAGAYAYDEMDEADPVGRQVDYNPLRYK